MNIHVVGVHCMNFCSLNCGCGFETECVLVVVPDGTMQFAAAAARWVISTDKPAATGFPFNDSACTRILSSLLWCARGRAAPTFTW